MQNATTVPGDFSSQWLSLNTKAMVDNGGTVTGMIPGAAIIRYKLNYSSPEFGTCSSGTDRTIDVYALPVTPVITYAVRPVFLVAATNSLCINKTFVLRGSPAGGSWNAAGSVTVTANGVVTTSSPGAGNVTYTVYNSFDCSSSKTINYDVVICEQARRAETDPTIVSKAGRIMLYPNPALSQFFMSNMKGISQITVCDMNGRQVLTEVIDGAAKKAVNCSLLPSGTFTILFFDIHGSVVSRTKFIKTSR